MANLTENPKEVKNVIQAVEFCKKYGLPGRIVGRWCWILFESKPDNETRQLLKDAGFRWSKRRGQWAHNCGHTSKPAHSYRPWDRYETTLLENYVNAGLGVAL